MKVMRVEWKILSAHVYCIYHVCAVLHWYYVVMELIFLVDYLSVSIAR